MVLPAALAFAITGCVITGGTLGGREKCWSEDDHRAAGLWRGTLQIDPASATLLAPEGNVLLLPGRLSTRVGEGGVGELVQDSVVVARTGDTVTLWGGIGGDGSMVVCALEQPAGP
jgi:hypothetical protein